MTFVKLSRLTAAVLAAWQWLFPDWEQHEIHARAIASARLCFPQDVSDDVVAKLVALQRDNLARQREAVLLLDARREKMLSMSLGLVGAMAGATQIFGRSWLPVAPAAAAWLLAALYLVWARRPIDIPVEASAEGFLRELPAGMKGQECDVWIADSHMVTAASLRSYSLVLGRHVFVASCLIAVGLTWLLPAAILIALRR